MAQLKKEDRPDRRSSNTEGSVAHGAEAGGRNRGTGKLANWQDNNELVGE